MDIIAALTARSWWRRQSPTASEFSSKVVAMLSIWVCLLHLVGRIGEAIAATFWSRPVPVNSASIPSRLPHPNPPGSALPFDVPLAGASDEQICAFMAFLRGGPSFSLASVDSPGGGAGMTRAGQLQAVANSAADYKGLLYQERMMTWIDDHFRLRKPNLKYPYVGAHW
jgi:hypothetical protein